MEQAKGELRQRMRQVRDALAPQERERLGEQIAGGLLADPCLVGARRVALYAAVGSEVATASLTKRLLQRGIEVALPRCDTSRRSLDFVPADGLAGLQPGPFGIPEPQGPAVPLESIDVVVLPALAFDRQGTRLGYGAGYYDRALAAFAGWRVGLCFSSQVLDRLPCAAHDVPVHLVITEHGPIRVGAPGMPTVLGEDMTCRM